MKNFLRFLIILLLLAAFLRVDFFFKVVYFFFAVYLLSRLWTRNTLDHVEIKRTFVERAFLGDKVPVKLNVFNNSRLPMPWLEVNEGLPVQLSTPPFYHVVISLAPHEKRHLNYTLTCRRRGYFTIGPLRLQSGGILGFAREMQGQVEPAHMIVYPKVIPLQRLGLPTRSPQVKLPANSPLFEDPARIMGVREYEPGDSPRRIHWPATATTGDLLVKQYESAIARETLICLDMDEDHYERGKRFTATELAITVAASVAHHVIIKEGLPAGIVTEAYDPQIDAVTRLRRPPRSERAHMMSILEVLARIQVASGAPFARLVRRETVDLSWGSTVMVVTGSERANLFDTLLQLRRSGFAPSLILVQPARASEDLRKQADLLNVPVHRVWDERDLETWV